MPTHQAQLFASSNNNNYKSSSPAKSSSSGSSTSKTKSPAKKNTGKNAATAGAAGAKKPTSTKPKTLELALKNITPDDFSAQLEQVKLSCPDSELRWLSHVSTIGNEITLLSNNIFPHRLHYTSTALCPTTAIPSSPAVRLSIPVTWPVIPSSIWL